MKARLRVQLVDDSVDKKQTSIVSSTLGPLPRIDVRLFDLSEFPFSRNLVERSSMDAGEYCVV